MFSSLHALFLGCAASFATGGNVAHTTVQAADEPLTVLGLLVAGDGAQASRADIVLAPADVVLAPGDALVYRVCTPGPPLASVAIELELSGGRRIAAPAPAGTNWRDVKLDLWPWAGAQLHAVRAVFDGLPEQPAAVYFDAIALARADGATRTLVDPPAASTAAGELSDGACVRALPFDADPPSEWLPARAADVTEPWFAFDLATLRTRASRGAAGGASEDSATVPHGSVWAGAGIPLRFARAGEAAACPAQAQRISLEPLDGGRFYDLYLALATTGDAALESTWQLVGVDGEVQPFQVRVPARGADGAFALEPAAGFELAGMCVLRVPVASPFSVAALELPDEPSLRLCAATAHWRKDAAAAPDFRRAWLAHTRPSAELARYLALTRTPELAPRANGTNRPAGREPLHERELFRRLLAGESAGFDVLLTERVRALEARVPNAERALVLLEPVVAGLDGSIAPAELRRTASAFARAWTEAARGDPALRLRAPEGRVLTWLAEDDRAALEALAECARSGALSVAPAGWIQGEWGVLGEEACVRQLAWGQLALEQAFGRASTLAWAPRDFGYLRQLPQLVGAVHCDSLLGAPTDWNASTRPLACRFSAPNGASVIAITPPRAAGSERAPLLGSPANVRALTLLARTRGGPALLVLPHVAGSVDGTAARASRRARAALAAELPLALTRTVGASELAAEFSAHTDLPQWRVSYDGASTRTRAWSDELGAWNRRAEDALVQAQTAMSLAAVDGLAPLRRLPQQLWERVLSNHAAAANGCTDPATRTDARDATASALALEREALESLAAGVDTRGLGRALFVYNPITWERRELVRVEGTDFVACDVKGHALPAQRTREGHTLVDVELPSLGHAVVRLVPRALAPPELTDPESRVHVDGWRIGNEVLEFEIDPATGEVVHLRTFADGRTHGERAAVVEFCPPSGAAQPGVLDTCELVERGPLRARVRTVRTFAGARVEQELTLAAGAARIAVHTRVSGLGDVSLRTTLRLVDGQFSATRSVPFAANKITTAGAGTERAATLGGIWQPGVDAGVGLCSDSAVACRAVGSELSLWLADAEPDGGAAARDITWAIVPLAGNARELAFAGASRELRFPVRSFVTENHAGARPPRHAFLEIARTPPNGRAVTGLASGVLLTQLAPALDDGAWIVRVYEAAGIAGRVQLGFGAPVASFEPVDLLERPLGESANAVARSARRDVEFELAPSTIETVRVRWRR